MSRVFRNLLTSVVISCVSVPVGLGHADSDEESHHKHGHHKHGHKHKGKHKHHHHHDKKYEGMTPDQMVKEGEERRSKLKDAGAPLPPEMKAEFDYHMEVVNIEMKALQDSNIKKHEKHFSSLNRHLKAAEHIVKKHEHQVAQAKKVEERKAKAEERKARAEERKAKAAERKAERAAKKAKREEEKKEKATATATEQKPSEKVSSAAVSTDIPDLPIHRDAGGGSDHGTSEGGDMRAPGTEAAKPAS